MKNTNYEDYEQMSTEIINSKYNNIGSTKRSKLFFTKKKIFFMVISLAVIVLILYLIFRPKKKSTENIQITEKFLNIIILFPNNKYAICKIQ